MSNIENCMKRCPTADGNCAKCTANLVRYLLHHSQISLTTPENVNLLCCTIYLPPTLLNKLSVCNLILQCHVGGAPPQNLTLCMGVLPPYPNEKLPVFACLLFASDTLGLYIGPGLASKDEAAKQ